jgi:hypothetical protein
MAAGVGSYNSKPGGPKGAWGGKSRGEKTMGKLLFSNIGVRALPAHWVQGI